MEQILNFCEEPTRTKFGELEKDNLSLLVMAKKGIHQYFCIEHYVRICEEICKFRSNGHGKDWRFED
jgi:hypothetical protein